MELKPRQEPAAVPVRDGQLTTLLRSPQHIEGHYSKIPPNLLGQGIDLTDLWAAVEDGLPLAINEIRRQREGVPEEAASQFLADVGPEISFLYWKMSSALKNDQDAFLAEIRARERLIESIRHERIDVEASAVMVAV